jgi:guanylate cyclase
MDARITAWLERLARAGALPGDADAERVRKATLMLFAYLTASAGLVWSGVYFLLGQPLAALIPLAYVLIATASLVHVLMTRRYRAFRFVQLAAILLMPVLVQWSLGGFVASGAARST